MGYKTLYVLLEGCNNNTVQGFTGKGTGERVWEIGVGITGADP